MTRPSKAQFDAVIRSMNGLQAYDKLKSMGYSVSQKECRDARVAYTGRGFKREKRYTDNGVAAYVPAYLADAPKACDALESAICALYAKTAKQRGCKLETAAILLNYSPAQIAKMGAAA